MPRITLLFLTAALSTAFVHGALADDRYPQIERSVPIGHGDLDLNKPQDARVMLARIEKAARLACGVMPERDEAYSSARQFVTKDYDHCTARATEQAVTSLHAPVVLRIYALQRPSSRQAAR